MLRWPWPIIGRVSGCGSNSRNGPRRPNESASAVLAVASGAAIKAPRGLRHHVAKGLRIEPGAAQYRGHDVVGQQFFEARLITAAVEAPVHDPSLPARLYAASPSTVSTL